MTIEEQLREIREKLDMLLSAQAVREHYTVAQAAAILGRSEYRIRDHCRNGRIKASRRMESHGPHREWVISHEEVMRCQREGLRPLAAHVNTDRIASDSADGTR